MFQGDGVLAQHAGSGNEQLGGSALFNPRETNKDVKRIETWMNNYPRKILGYKSPNQIAA